MRMEDILMLLGGLALFLYGMQMMSNGLETAAGNKMKSILEKLTSNRIKGVVVGAVITAVIQSSSATTVMVVGFVNSGLMTLNQAVWVIMGANIGTTITGQLIALDIGAIAPLIAFGGVAAITFVKNERVRHISEIFAGLGVLFIGMGMMGDAMQPLQQSETFVNFMTKASKYFSRSNLYGGHPVFLCFGRNFTGIGRDRCDSAIKCCLCIIWTEYRNLYYSSSGIYRYKDKCKARDRDPFDVQYFWFDLIYIYQYADTVCVMGGGTFAGQHGSADCKCSYNL